MPRSAQRPAPRPYISTIKAAELLGCDPRTVRKMVEQGRLEGVKYRSTNDRFYEWRVFEDQPSIQAAYAARSTHGDSGELARQNDALRAELQQTRQGWAEDRRQWTDERAVLEARRRNADSKIEALLTVTADALEAGELYRRAADKWATVAGTLRDLVAQDHIPDDARAIEEH